MSSFAVTDAGLPGLKIVHLPVFRDDRGFFVERYHAQRFSDHGLPSTFLQDNHSRSLPGVLRGLHYQAGQGKLLSCLHGRIWDVTVDIRRHSPHFGQYHILELNGSDGRLLWIPPGFAHGFCVLGEEPADVFYKVDAPYDPSAEGGIRWDDPDLAIPWPLQNPRLSLRDQSLPPFRNHPF